MNRKKAIVLRARLAFIGMCLVGMAIAGRLIWVQVVQGPRWLAELQKNNVQERVIVPTRGNIYSDNGSLLATSLPMYRLAMNPHKDNIPDTVFTAGLDSLSWLMSRTFHERTEGEYKTMLRQARRDGRKFIYLTRTYIDYPTKKKVMHWPLLRSTRKISGAIFDKIERRYTPFGELAARTVGYVKETRGVGLEQSFDAMLAGTSGRGIFRRIAGGHWKPIVEISRPHSGFDIQTTLDVNIQDVAQAALRNALLKHQASFGCVVLMKVETGEIKAMANLGRNAAGSYSENFNYAVGLRTEPGSTFKLATFMALLEEGCVSLTDSVATGKGKYQIMDKTMSDSHEGGYGTISALRAFAQSSNIGTAKLAMRCFGSNHQKFINYIQKFGLLSPLNFQIKGEARPLIKTPGAANWYGTTLPWLSTGYEVEMSPLQMLTFYNAVANGGTIMQPFVVKEIRDGDHVLEQYKPKVLAENIASEKTLQNAKDLLIEVVETGTASEIKNTSYRIAGKTGTAQKIINRRHVNKYFTSFCGFFPADKPKYSCIVVIDQPEGIYQYGADVAAPVFKEVSEKVNSQEIDMHKELGPPQGQHFAKDLPRVGGGNRAELHQILGTLGVADEAKDSVGDWVQARAADQAVRWSSTRYLAAPERLPDVRGMMLRDALYLIENKGYRVRHLGQGRVTNMTPTPGRSLPKGSTVVLTLR